MRALLVMAHRGEHGRRRETRRGARQAVRREQPGDLARESLIEAGEPCGELQRGDEADRDGLAVTQVPVARGRLDAVADGMAQVEDRAQARLAGIVRDDEGLEARTALHELALQLRSGGAVRSPRTSSQSGPPVRSAVFTHSAKPAAHSGGGERCEQPGIGQHGLRRPERADVVLGGHVDGGLAADRRIDLPDERARPCNPVDPAAERGRREAGRRR